MAKGKGKAKKSDCAIAPELCLYPKGTVTWVYCESCSGWYHCPCVKVDPKKANDEDFIFICDVCKPAKEKVRLRSSI